jgi:hypothetical protein
MLAAPVLQPYYAALVASTGEVSIVSLVEEVARSLVDEVAQRPSLETRQEILQSPVEQGLPGRVNVSGGWLG